MKSKAKIGRHLKCNVSNKIKINFSIRFYIRPEVSKNNFHVRLPKLTIEPFDGI